MTKPATSSTAGRALTFATASLRAVAAALLVAWCCTLASAVAAAQADDGQFSTAARHAILVDMTSNAVLFEKNADERFPPASMSKLMTLAVIFKALKAGRLKLTDEFLMSVHAWRTGGAPSRTSAMFVPVNTKVTLDELIQGIIVQSGNDAAIAVAEGIAGSEAAFAKLMNAEAASIGLKASHFVNPTGLPHADHLMTARDLTVLARHLIVTYPEYYKLFAQKEFKYRRFTFRNRNRLLFRDLGVDGLKTGYVEAAGNAITFSAAQDGRRLIGVMAGLDTKNERWQEAQRLIQWGFKAVARSLRKAVEIDPRQADRVPTTKGQLGG